VVSQTRRGSASIDRRRARGTFMERQTAPGHGPSLRIHILVSRVSLRHSRKCDTPEVKVNESFHFRPCAASCGTHTFEISVREAGPKYRAIWIEERRPAACTILTSTCNATRCPPGTYSHSGSTICTECAQGTFNSDPSATACESCPEWSGM
jgi:hypothetical protein